MKPLRTRIIPGAGPGTQHIAGIQEPLPPGERLLWQGAPDWRVLAVTALHLRKLGLYFGALLLLHMAASMRDGATLAHALGNALPLALLAAGALGLLAFYAWASARTTIYAVTTRRVVLRVGVALPITVNLPFTGIESVALRRRDGVVFVHLINRSSGIPNLPNSGAMDEIQPVGPITVRMRLEAKPRRVSWALEDGAVDWQWEGGTLVARIPAVRIHGVLVVEI
jgi:hypothetical protein